MEYLMFLVICTLCAGMMMVMYQRIVDLTDHIQKSEYKIANLEKLITSNEAEILIKQRVTNAEGRMSIIEKSINSIKHTTIEDSTLMANQIEFLNETMNSVIETYSKLSSQQTEILKKSLMYDTNVCVLSSKETCPKGLIKTTTFGIISYPFDNKFPKGYVKAGNFNSNGWYWLSGALCCVEAVMEERKEIHIEEHTDIAKKH